ncbi:EndoU domain-containing protein [Myroides fluvii]|uniref:EndoU domain-containing protein n=1 Tax=Myroides fluvii TaxID=2572594 RepID=UPI00131EB179|nr:EndoU domain-containing protein [Myroides fluvii]
MFPSNWDLERIKQEIAFVYENTVASGINKIFKKNVTGLNQYVGQSSNGFLIVLEVDDLGKILNAYPKL